MRIPASFYNAEASVEPRTGTSGDGRELYGEAVTIRCLHAPGRRLVRGPNGEQVVSEATLYCPPGTSAPPGSRVTVAGRARTVLDEKDWTAPGFPLEPGVEVVLE